MIIAQVKEEPEGFLGDCIEAYACIIELKFKGTFQEAENILEDYEKIKYYIENLNIDCNYYMATIWEYEDDETKWVEDTDWVKGRVIELNASYIPNSEREMRFYICSH